VQWNPPEAGRGDSLRSRVGIHVNTGWPRVADRRASRRLDAVPRSGEVWDDARLRIRCRVRRHHRSIRELPALDGICLSYESSCAQPASVLVSHSRVVNFRVTRDGECMSQRRNGGESTGERSRLPVAEISEVAVFGGAARKRRRAKGRQGGNSRAAGHSNSKRITLRDFRGCCNEGGRSVALNSYRMTLSASPGVCQVVIGHEYRDVRVLGGLLSRLGQCPRATLQCHSRQ